MNTQLLNEIVKPYWGERWHPSVRIDNGWCDLVNNLHNKIIEIEPNYKLHQIKEKFGILRFYYELPSSTNCEKEELIDNLVNEAELESQKICEICGAINNVKYAAIKKWLKTLCVVCLSEYPENIIDYDINKYKPIIFVQ